MALAYFRECGLREQRKQDVVMYPFTNVLTRVKGA